MRKAIVLGLLAALVMSCIAPLEAEAQSPCYGCPGVVGTISGTTNEVESSGTVNVTLGLPDDVVVTNSVRTGTIHAGSFTYTGDVLLVNGLGTNSGLGSLDNGGDFIGNLITAEDIDINSNASISNAGAGILNSVTVNNLATVNDLDVNSAASIDNTGAGILDSLTVNNLTSTDDLNINTAASISNAGTGLFNSVGVNYQENSTGDFYARGDRRYSLMVVNAGDNAVSFNGDETCWGIDDCDTEADAMYYHSQSGILSLGTRSSLLSNVSIDMQKNADAIEIFRLKNPNTGTSAGTGMIWANDNLTGVGALRFYLYGSNHTYDPALGVFAPARATLQVTEQDGLAVGSSYATGTLRFFAGGQTASAFRTFINGTGVMTHNVHGDATSDFVVLGDNGSSIITADVSENHVTITEANPTTLLVNSTTNASPNNANSKAYFQTPVFINAGGNSSGFGMVEGVVSQRTDGYARLIANESDSGLYYCDDASQCFSLGGTLHHAHGGVYRTSDETLTVPGQNIYTAVANYTAATVHNVTTDTNSINLCATCGGEYQVTYHNCVRRSAPPDVNFVGALFVDNVETAGLPMARAAEADYGCAGAANIINLPNSAVVDYRLKNVANGNNLITNSVSFSLTKQDK